MQEKRPVPQNIHQVKWRADDRLLTFGDYTLLKDEFARAIDMVKPDLVHAGPVQRVAYLPVLVGFHPLLTMSWGFDLLEDACRDEIRKGITHKVMENSDWFTSDCETTRELAVKFGMDRSRTTVFPWGVDLSLFNLQRRGMMRRQVGYEEDLLIVHTRSWEPRYGVDVALEGFWKAFQRIDNLRLFLLGGGSGEKEVRNFINQKGLEDRVHFCGYRQNEDLAGYYQAADLYLSASHIDGSSVALMEAMACGCVPLVSDIPANLEWVKDGVEGWVFHDNDTDDLAEKLIHIVANREEMIKRGQRARQKVEAKADWKKNSRVLLRTYQDVIALFNAGAESQKS